MWSGHRVRYWGDLKENMMPPRHILIVNARNVTQPVFVIGAPHSGAEAVGRALKLSPGFHVTIGQQSVLQAVYAFARRPSLYNGRGDVAATVIRDAFAQGWQLNPTSCLECTPQCRSAAGLKPSEVGPCVEQRGLSRFGDASPDLAYCAEALVHAFPDALIVQVVRDGRDTVAAMLEDQVAMSWFRPGVVNIDTEFPNPFYGVEDESDRQAWPSLTAAGKCAMRWRGAIRLAARLRLALADNQLKTLRYEDMARDPGGTASALTGFIGDQDRGPGHRDHQARQDRAERLAPVALLRSAGRDREGRGRGAAAAWLQVSQVRAEPLARRPGPFDP